MASMESSDCAPEESAEESCSLSEAPTDPEVAGWGLATHLIELAKKNNRVGSWLGGISHTLITVCVLSWGPVTKVAIQRRNLWSLESSMRMLVYMTTGEKHEIESRFSSYFSSGEVELAIVNFGKPRGRACTKLLWQQVLKDKMVGWEHNEALSSIMPCFSIAKSLLLSSRAMQEKGEDGCYCFPRTSIMPAGCFHYPVAVGKAPSSSKSKPFHCSQCSRCLRCNKSLA